MLQILATGQGFAATVLVGAADRPALLSAGGGAKLLRLGVSAQPGHGPRRLAPATLGHPRTASGGAGDALLGNGDGTGSLCPARRGGLRVAEPDRHVPSRADLRSRIRPALGRGDLPARPLRVAPRLVRIAVPPRCLLLAGRTLLGSQDRIRRQPLRPLRRLCADLPGAPGDPLRRDRGEGIHRDRASV